MNCNHFIKGCWFFLLFTMGLFLKAESPIKSTNTRSWFTYLSQVDLSEKWSTSFELHERSNAFLANHGQFLFRPSLDYHLNQKIFFSFGYTYIHTEPLSQSKSFNENNLWEQVLVKSKLQSLQLQNRFRVEQRWIQQFAERDKTVYNLRFRYRLNAKINFTKIGSKSIFLQSFDELWYVIDSEKKSFDFSRNWIYAGIGIDFSNSANFHAGYLHQLDREVNRSIYTNIVQLTFQLNINRKVE